MYVYNKDISYTGCKVTINALKNTKNYLEGGKLKKVSLVPSDKLSDYSKNYTNDNLTNYNKFTAYYGIYTSEEIENILFATVKADSEDLMDGDPYYFYKASGAVSSDIDLYFEGEGYLKVTSKNKEGIETKGNLSLVGGEIEGEETNGLYTKIESYKNGEEISFSFAEMSGAINGGMNGVGANISVVLGGTLAVEILVLVGILVVGKIVLKKC